MPPERARVLRVVLDTNVLVSGLIIPGKPRELLTRITRKELALVISKEILDEFIKVMNREKFAEYATEEQVDRFVESIGRMAELVELKSNVKVVKEDPKDDVVISTAIDARADWIISGDHHLLGLKEFRGIKILAVGEALRRLRKDK